jgi:outer membrane protein
MKRTIVALLTVAAWPGASGAAESGGSELTLDEALRLASANHPRLLAARAQTEAQAARVGQTRAPLLPQVSGNAGYTRAYGRQAASPSSGLFGSFGGGSWSNSYALGLGASQLIYDFGQTTGRWDAAKATLASQEQSERNFAVQVAFNLRSAFFTAAAARAMVKVAEENLRNQDLHLRQIQGFVEAGTRPEIDLAQVRTTRANAQVQLISSQVGYDIAKALLNQAMGSERGTDYEVASPPAEPVEGEDGSTDSLLPMALAARPDLLALARQLEAQELTTRSIKGGYAPALSASTGLSESGAALDRLDFGWYGKLTLNWQLFGGGITDAQMREARASTAGLRAQYELQRQQVRADLEQARLGVRATKAAIEAAHEATVNARVRLTLAEGRYQAGVGNAIELGDSQVALTTAAAQEVQAIYSLATARARLRQALGQR